MKSLCKDVNKEEITRLFGKNFCDLENNYIFPINCKKELENEKEFGLDRLFLKAYDILKGEKISLDIILGLKNGNKEKIDELLSKYLLFKLYKSRKDIIINAKTQTMKKILKFSIYAPLLIYVPDFGKANNIERMYFAMTTSIAKVYARNLTKEEALKLVKLYLDNKKEEIKNGTNTKFKSFFGILLSIIAIIYLPYTIIWTLIFGSFLGPRVYKYGISVNEHLSKEFEENIPLYLFVQSISFNDGIDSLKVISQQNKIPTPNLLI